MLLLDPSTKAASVKQVPSSSSTSASAKASNISASGKEREMTLGQKHISAETDAGPSGRIVLKISTKAVVPDKTPQSKVRKHATGSKSKSSSGGGKTVHSIGTGLSSALAAGAFRKALLDEDVLTASRVKLHSDKKKRQRSKTEGFSSKDGSSAQMLAIDKVADFSVNQPSEHKNASFDKSSAVGPVEKPQSEEKTKTSGKHGEHSTGDSSSAEMQATKKTTGLTPSLHHEHKKLSSADADATGQKLKVKKLISSGSKGHATKSAIDAKASAIGEGTTDSQPNFPECKNSSFVGDGAPGLSRQKSSQPKVKKAPFSSSTEVHGIADSADTVLAENASSDKSARFASNKLAKRKTSSLVSRKNEQPKLAGSKTDGGREGQGSTDANRVSAELHRGHLKQSQPTKHATKTPVVPKAKITHRTKTTVHVTGDDPPGKLKLHQRSASDSHSHQKHSHVSAAASTADSVSSHSKPLHQQQQSTGSSCYPKSHTESSMMIVSDDGLRTEKPGLSATEGNFPSDPCQHPKPLHHRRLSSGLLESCTESALAVVSSDGLRGERLGIFGVMGEFSGDPRQRPKPSQHQRHSGGHLESHSESVIGLVSGDGVERPPPSKALGVAGHGSSQLLKAKRMQKHASGESFQRQPKDSLDKTEKPESKVVSLADYKKRKSDPSSVGKPAATSLSKSAQTKTGQGDAHCMTTSLAEQLIMSYASQSKPANECVPLLESLRDFAGEDVATVGQDTTQSEELGSFGDVGKFPSSQVHGIWPLRQHQKEYPVSSTVDISAVSSTSYGILSDHIEPVGHDITQSEELGSFGDDSNFSTQEHGIWPPVQHRKESASFSAMDICAVSTASSDHVESAQRHTDIFSVDNTRQQDTDIIAKVVETEPVCGSSSLSLEADFKEKVPGFLEPKNDRVEPAVSSSRSGSDGDKDKPQKMEPDMAEGLTDVLEEFLASVRQVELALASNTSDNSSKVTETGGDISQGGIESVDAGVSIQDYFPVPVDVDTSQKSLFPRSVYSAVNIQGTFQAREDGDVGREGAERQFSQLVDSVENREDSFQLQASVVVGQQEIESDFAQSMDSNMIAQDTLQAQADSDIGREAIEAQFPQSQDLVVNIQETFQSQAGGDIGHDEIEPQFVQSVDLVVNVRDNLLSEADNEIGQEGIEPQVLQSVDNLVDSGLNFQDNIQMQADEDINQPPLLMGHSVENVHDNSETATVSNDAGSSIESRPRVDSYSNDSVHVVASSEALRSLESYSETGVEEPSAESPAESPMSEAVAAAQSEITAALPHISSNYQLYSLFFCMF